MCCVLFNVCVFFRCRLGVLGKTFGFFLVMVCLELCGLRWVINIWVFLFWVVILGLYWKKS